MKFIKLQNVDKTDTFISLFCKRKPLSRLSSL